MIDFTRFSTPVMKSIYQIRKGDVIETMTGMFAFDRIPKGGKSWYGKSMNDGKNYRIRLMFSNEFKVLGTYNFVKDPETILKPMTNDVNDLKSGDLFVIKHGRGENAELFRYVRSTGRRIVAINPVTNKIFNIDTSFTFTKVDNLPY